MIAETAVIMHDSVTNQNEVELLSNSWNDERLYDVEPCWAVSLVDLGITPFEEDLYKYAGNVERSIVPDFSVESSVTGSDCGSNDHYADITSDLESNLQRLSESLSSPLKSVLDNDFTFPSDIEPLHWSDSELEVNQYSKDKADEVHESASDVIIPSASCSLINSPVQKKRRSNCHRVPSKSWTELSSSERLSVIQDLTEVVSQQMGLREQLDVIKIINPDATISASDTEFVIDLERLNDEKLQQVQKYIRQQCRSQSTSLSQSHHMTESRSECCSSGVTPTKCNRQKQKQETKEARERQKKERKQVLKEKRSGLFKKEEVLSLSLDMPEQLAEVDILT